MLPQGIGSLPKRAYTKKQKEFKTENKKMVKNKEG